MDGTSIKKTLKLNDWDTRELRDPWDLTGIQSGTKQRRHTYIETYIKSQEELVRNDLRSNI